MPRKSYPIPGISFFISSAIPFSAGRIGDPGHEPGRASLVDPWRKQGPDHGGSGGVGVDVAGHVDSFFSRRFHHSKGLFGKAFQLFHYLMMGDVHRTAASPADIDRLGNCVQGVPRFAPHVGGVYAPIRGRDPAELHELVSIGKAPRRVDEPG